MRRWPWIVVVLALMAAIAPSAQATPAWSPTTADRLHIQFSGPLHVPSWATFVEIDGSEASARTVRSLHARGLHVACYVDAGSAEKFRPDYVNFPASVLGKPMQGWPDERWLDVRKIALLSPIITARVDQCERKEFDAIEFDNVDGWTNDTGFALTRADNVRYVKWLTRLGHSHDLAVGLKNALGIVATLADTVDWALNEECFHYRECARYRPLTRLHKPVFELEYGGNLQDVCANAHHLGLIAQVKRLRLGAWSRPCT